MQAIIALILGKLVDLLAKMIPVWIKEWNDSRAKEKVEAQKVSDREAAIEKAIKIMLEAGSTPGLTPEQRQKEQENAFKDMQSIFNNLP